MAGDARPPAYLEWERDQITHGCRDKTRFTQHRKAKRMADRFRGTVYHCERCDGLHITSKRR